MAKGQEYKNEIAKKILETFEGSAAFEKELRIPYGDVEIKVVLTVAKENKLQNVAPTNAFPTPLPSAPQPKMEGNFEQNPPSLDEIEEVEYYFKGGR